MVFSVMTLCNCGILNDAVNISDIPLPPLPFLSLPPPQLPPLTAVTVTTPLIYNAKRSI